MIKAKIGIDSAIFEQRVRATRPFHRYAEQHRFLLNLAKSLLHQSAFFQYNMLRETVKILVLETDETDPRTKKKHGGFGDVFRDLFQTAGRSHEPPLGVELDMHFVVDDPVCRHFLELRHTC